MKTLHLLSILFALSLFISSCDGVADSGASDARGDNVNIAERADAQNDFEGSPDEHAVTGSESILDIAASDENFSVLAQAVIFAGLDEALDGNRQLTVFAPTNDAFVALLGALNLTAEELFVEENKSLVRDILLYHVAPGKRTAKSVVKADKIRTLLKKFAEIETEDGKVFIGNEENGFAQIIQTDIFASNGVIHVLNAVLLPPTSDDKDDDDDDDDDDNDDKDDDYDDDDDED